MHASLNRYCNSPGIMEDKFSTFFQPAETMLTLWSMSHLLSVWRLLQYLLREACMRISIMLSGKIRGDYCYIHITTEAAMEGLLCSLAEATAEAGMLIS